MQLIIPLHLRSQSENDPPVGVYPSPGRKQPPNASLGSVRCRTEDSFARNLEGNKQIRDLPRKRSIYSRQEVEVPASPFLVPRVGSQRPIMELIGGDLPGTTTRETRERRSGGTSNVQLLGIADSFAGDPDSRVGASQSWRRTPPRTNGPPRSGGSPSRPCPGDLYLGAFRRDARGTPTR